VSSTKAGGQASWQHNAITPHFMLAPAKALPLNWAAATLSGRRKFRPAIPNLTLKKCSFLALEKGRKTSLLRAHLSRCLPKSPSPSPTLAPMDLFVFVHNSQPKLLPPPKELASLLARLARGIC